MISRFGKLAGVDDPLTFDWYWDNIPEELLDITDSEFMDIFLKHLENSMPDVPKMLNQAFIDLDKKVVESEKTAGTQTESMEHRLSADIVEFTEMNTVKIFNVEYAEDDVDEYYPIITGVKDRAALLEKLGIANEKSSVLKIDSSKPVSCDAIISMIQEEKPIKTLDLSDCTWLSKADFFLIINECWPLTTLNLTGCTQITEDAMNDILIEGSEIQNINLTDCTQLRRLAVNDRTPNLILPEDTNIEFSLNLRGRNDLTNEVLIALLDKYPNVTLMNLPGCKLLTDAVVESILAKCPRLTSCNVRGCTGLSQEVIEKLPTPPALDLNLIRQELPGLNIIDAEFWKSVGVAVDEIPPFENASMEIRDYMATLNREGIEGFYNVEDVKDYTGATLMLLPKELTLDRLSNMGVPFSFFFDMIKNEYGSKANEEACWVLIANSVLIGSRSMLESEHINRLSEIRCELPEILAATALTVATYKISKGKQRLLNDTYTLCKEKMCGSTISVGSQAPADLTLTFLNPTYRHALLGVSPSRKFSALGP